MCTTNSGVLKVTTTFTTEGLSLRSQARPFLRCADVCWGHKKQRQPKARPRCPPKQRPASGICDPGAPPWKAPCTEECPEGARALQKSGPWALADKHYCPSPRPQEIPGVPCLGLMSSLGPKAVFCSFIHHWVQWQAHFCPSCATFPLSDLSPVLHLSRPQLCPQWGPGAGSTTHVLGSLKPFNIHKMLWHISLR